MSTEQMPYWCIGKCQIRWDHVSPDDTDLVCLSCTLRGRVPPGQRAEILRDGWDAWLPQAQATFERKALAANAAARRQSR